MPRKISLEVVGVGGGCWVLNRVSSWRNSGFEESSEV